MLKHYAYQFQGEQREPLSLVMTYIQLILVHGHVCVSQSVVLVCPDQKKANGSEKIHTTV